MPLYEKIDSYVAQHNLLPHGAKIIIGLSGGPDSIFLLHYLAQLHKQGTISLIAAHLDHQWRTESWQDALVCHTITKELNIPYIQTTLTELAVEQTYNGSKEEYARRARRYFFEKLLHEHGADQIALAHHLQDQEETFFIRLIRGSSLSGLTAMKPISGFYIRPLLEINKSDILAWLAENKCEYAIDQSNTQQTYLRNRIRQSFDTLRSSDTRFDANFLTTLHRLQDTERFLEKLAQEALNNVNIPDMVNSTDTTNTTTHNTVALDCVKLIALDPVLQYRVLMKWLIAERVPFPTTESFLNEIMRFLKTHDGGMHRVHEKWVIVKKQKRAWIKNTHD